MRDPAEKDGSRKETALAEEYAYASGGFAAREEQIGLVSDKLKLAQRGNPDHRLLVEFFGVPGVGKSWLLARLCECYAARPQGCTVSALVTFERVSQDTDWYALLRTIAEQIRAQVPTLDATAFEPQEAAKERRSELSAELVKLVNGLPRSHISLLLFDATEESSELLEWLEDDIVCPLLRSNRVVLVFAGRHWLPWKRFEVRQRVEAVSLEPFGECDSTAAMLEKLGVDPQLAGVFFAYAFGHPLTTRIIVSALEDAGISPSEIDATSIRERESLISDKVHERVIRERFLKALPRGRDRDRLERLVEIACIPRRFALGLLRAFAQRLDPAHFAAETGEYYSNAIREMLNANLAQGKANQGQGKGDQGRGKADQRGLRLLPLLRRIVSKNLSVRDAARFRRWHQAALRQYNSWIEDNPSLGASFLIEWAYHQAWFLVSGGQLEAETVEQVGHEFRERWVRISQHPYVQWDLATMAENLKAGLANDLEFQRSFAGVHARITQEAEKG